MGLLCFSTANFPAAVAAFETTVRHRPHDLAALTNLGLSLLRCGRAQEGLDALRRAHAARPDQLNLLDGLADAYGQLGDLASAQRYGEAALQQRDAASVNRFPHRPVSGAPIPPFRAEQRSENVIAFCLFGDGARYRQGAVKNARAAPFIYPSWTARFYCSVDQPKELLDALKAEGAETVLLPPPSRSADGLFWRFTALDDPRVRRFLIRDIDSVVNVRERVAVDAWLASGRHFHVLRDHYGHTDLMLAGLWGGVTGVLPPLAEMLKGFTYKPATEARTVDQVFLRTVAWPLVKQSCLIHDSLYRVFGAEDFPPYGALPPGRHVGDNDAAPREAAARPT